MTATSVTGLSGNGTVAGLQKGPDDRSMGVEKLIGPKIVACGREILSSTTAVVETPAPSDSISNYIVLLTTHSATVAYISTDLAAIASTGMVNFTITAGSGATVDWALVKKGV